jgi:hypothetical protein
MFSRSAGERGARFENCLEAKFTAFGEFIVYAQNHPGVVFLRKDEIAHFALSSPQTIREAI